jgi:hypothetical protein
MSRIFRLSVGMVLLLTLAAFRFRKAMPRLGK